MAKEYFVSYTTNKFELPQYGWNVWEVEENKRSKGNPRSFKIIKVIIGGKKRSDAKNISSSDAEQYIVNNKIEVFERIFNYET